MSILGTTHITTNTPDKVLYISDNYGNVDVYVPITASSLSPESSIELVGTDVESWCSNVGLLYAVNQPQGDIWFAHVKLAAYRQNSEHTNPNQRSVTLIIRLKTTESPELHVGEHSIFQQICEGEYGEECVYDLIIPTSSQNVTFKQDCSAIEDIKNSNVEKTYILTQEC